MGDDGGQLIGGVRLGDEIIGDQDAAARQGEGVDHRGLDRLDQDVERAVHAVFETIAEGVENILSRLASAGRKGELELGGIGLAQPRLQGGRGQSRQRA